MAVSGYGVGAVQIVVGGLVSFIPGAQGIGISLMISGAFTAVATALAPSPGGDGGLNRSATYGWDDVSGAWEGAPRWYVLGERRRPLDYLSAFTEQRGNKTYLNCLLYAGEGGDHGIESIEDLRVNDQPVEHWKKVTVEKRYGTQSQTVISGFGKVSVPWTDGTKLDEGDTWTWTTKRPVDEVGVVLAWLGGFYEVEHGQVEKAFWWGDVYYQDEGSSTWVRVDPPEKDDFWLDSITVAGKKVKSPWGKHDWGTWQKSLSVVRGLMKITWTTKKVRTIRVRSYQGDDEEDRQSPTVLRVEEVESDTRTYAGVALVALRLLAQEQLSGGLPKITATIRGWKVQNQGDSSAAWTRNPSKLLEAVLLDEDDGLGNWIAQSDLDDGSGGSWRTVRDRCDALAAATGEHAEAHWQLDYAVDTRQPADEHIRQMLVSFRALLVEAGGKLYLLQDVAASTDRTFDARQSPSASTRPVLALEDGTADIVEREVPQDQRLTHVRVGYQDRDEDHEKRLTEELVDPDWSDGDPLVRQEVYLAGVTRGTQAVREGRHVLQRSRLRTRTCEVGVGPGDLDLLPTDVVALSADYPTWAGTLWQVVRASYGQHGHGRLTLLEYDADAYADTSDTLPARSDWLTRSEALKKARQVPRGATNVRLSEVQGSTHLGVWWEATGDPALRFWRVYLSDGSGAPKGRLLAECDPDDRAYLVRDVHEGAYTVRVLAVSHGGTEEDWEDSAGTASTTVTRRTTTPATPANAAVAVVDSSVSARVMVDAPPSSDPPVKLEVVRGADEFVGQLVAELDLTREGVTRDDGQRTPSVAVPMLPGRGSGGADTTLVVRSVGLHGRKAGASVSRTVPAFDLPNHTATLVASVVGATRTNFPAAATTDAHEYDATDGVRLREFPAGQDATGANGWGTGAAGLLVGVPGTCHYLPSGLVTSDEVDLGSTLEGVLECYDEARRKSATAWPRPGTLCRWPGSAVAFHDGTPFGPLWTSRVLRGDGKLDRPLRRTSWEYRVGTSSPLTGDWLPYVDGTRVVGRYVQVRLTLRDPLGLHQVHSARVYVRLWVPWSETTIPTGVVPEAAVTQHQGALAIGAGQVSESVVTTAVDYVVASGVSLVLASGTTAVTLPDANLNAGRTVAVKKIDSAGTTVTVDTAGGNIDGAATSTLVTRWQALRVVSDGLDWYAV
jgi:hypothetical protein